MKSRLVGSIALVGLAAATLVMRRESTVVWRLDARTMAVKAVENPPESIGKVARDHGASVNGRFLKLEDNVDGGVVKAYSKGKLLWATNLPSSASPEQKKSCNFLFGAIRAGASDSVLVQSGGCDEVIHTRGVAASDGSILWERTDTQFYDILPLRRIAAVKNGFIVGGTSGSDATLEIIDGLTGVTQRKANVPSPGEYWMLASDGRFAVASYPDNDANVSVDFGVNPPIVHQIAALNRTRVDVFDGVMYEAGSDVDNDSKGQGLVVRATSLSDGKVLWTSHFVADSKPRWVENITASQAGIFVAIVSDGSVTQFDRVDGRKVGKIGRTKDDSGAALSVPSATSTGGIIGDKVIADDGVFQIRGTESTYDRVTDTIVYAQPKVPMWRRLLKRPKFVRLT